MNDQCNGCGSFDEISKCSFCPTLLCGRCSRRHSMLCEELQKRKKRGEGPTIANVQVPAHRAGHETPETTGPDRHFAENPALGAPYDLSTPGVTMDEAVKAMEARLTAPLVMTVTPAPPTEHYKRFVDEPTPVDQGLAAVKDLLEEK